MHFVRAEWRVDVIVLHFKDDNGAPVIVSMSAHDAVDFNVAFDSWVSKNKSRLFDAMRREDRRKDSVR
jgi:hypothetical protein